MMMKIFKNIVFLTLVGVFVFSPARSSHAESEYFVQKKDGTLVAKGLDPKIYKELQEGGFEIKNPLVTEKVECSDKEKQALKTIDAGFKAINDIEKKNSREARQMMKFLEDPQNLHRWQKLMVKCIYGGVL